MCQAQGPEGAQESTLSKPREALAPSLCHAVTRPWVPGHIPQALDLASRAPFCQSSGHTMPFGG